MDNNRLPPSSGTKPIAVTLLIFGVLMLIFAIVRYNSAMSQFTAAAGKTDPLPIILAVVGVPFTIFGILALFGGLPTLSLHALPNWSEPIFYCIMRLIVGLMFACHGAAKLLGWFPDPKHPAAAHALDAMTMAGGSIELIGGLLIAVGLLTPIAAFLASGMMAVAFFMVHAQMGSIVPYVNKGELAVLYCFVFLYISAHGGGPWSLDAMLFRNREERIGTRLSPL